MVVRSKGIRSKTRHKFQKRPRERGMPPITHSLRDFPVGSKVAIVINSSIQKGMPHHRFQGLTCTVKEKRGDAFVLSVRVGGMLKTVIARAEHLKLITPAPSA